jgi:HK97 family phage major capsid protein
MASDTKTVPRRSSGLTAYFVSDNSEVTASDKEWDQVNLVAKKLGVLAKYSSELAEDAVISIGDDLTDEIAYAFANKEDECGFKGDGTSTYGGITGVLNAVADGSRYEAAGGNIAFSDLDFADFEGMVGQLPQYAARNAKWYISRVGYYASMARLLDAAGGNTIETLSDGSRRLMFLGYPVVLSQVLSDTTGDQASTSILAFGDLAMAATLGNRRGIRVLISPHRYMEYDQIGILGTERMDINVHERGDASNAGAIIVLDTPSS